MPFPTQPFLYVNITLTRKRDKAQRVARPACVNATVHFLLTYRLAMLLPPSEWPLKTSTQRIVAYVNSPPMQMHHNISWITGPKFTKFVAVVFFFIDGANKAVKAPRAPHSPDITLLYQKNPEFISPGL